MTHTDNAAEVGMHVFERAGLGVAPFRCVGMLEKTFQAHRDAPVQPGGSCDYCGNGIRYVYQVRGRDGRVFGVGCDCVERTGDRGLIKSYKTRPEVRALNRDKAKASDDRVIGQWNALIADEVNRAKLAAIIVPGRPWVPGDTTTLLDSITRLWGMCGAAGRKRTLKTLKHHLA